MRKINLSTTLLALGFWALAALAQAKFSAPGLSGPFQEKLVAARPASAQEQARLDEQVAKYEKQSLPEGLKALRDYLKAEPQSPWAASLWLNLGLREYQAGYYSRCTEAYGQAWDLAKDSKNKGLRAVADRAGAERARMLSRVGRLAELEAQVLELQKRPLMGLPARYLEDAYDGMRAMKQQPGISFRCGPFALQNLLIFKKDKRALDPKLINSKSEPEGFSLQQVLDLASSLKFPMQAIKRAPGSAVPVPAIVHWRMGHYAALVEVKDGLYHLVDPTFIEEHWVTLDALEDEGSGYFLVERQKLLPGWSEVEQKELKSVRGKGYVSQTPPEQNPCEGTATGGSCKSGCMPGAGGAGGGSCTRGMPVANIDLNQASLKLTDTPLFYEPSRGPAVEFPLNYHQRTANATYGVGASTGANWSNGWVAYHYVSVLNNPGVPCILDMYYDGTGGCRNGTGIPPSTQVLADIFVERGGGISADQPHEVTDPDGVIRRHLRSGWVESYALERWGSTESGVSGWIARLSKLSDPQGNSLEYGYDTSGRLATVTDAVGGITHLYYTNADTSLVTQVLDPFGRHADLSYDDQTRLTSISDMHQLQTSFVYDSVTADRLISMTTPYGTTAFSYVDGIDLERSITITDPMSRQRRATQTNLAGPAILWDNSAVPDPSKLKGSMGFAEYRNTFYWDEKGMAEAPDDLSKAFVYHFLHGTVANHISTLLESVRPPAKNRIYFNYPGQSGEPYYSNGITQSRPSKVGTVLDDGSTQVDQYEYNDLLNVTKHIDPAGHELDYEYASNGRDVVRIKNGNGDVLARFEYDGPASRPTKVYDASGQATTLGYNSYGQMTSVQLPTGESTTLTYDTAGFLTDIYPPAPGTHVHFTPDAVQRIATSADAVNGQLSYEYDDLNRLTSVGYPDGTSEEIVYDKLDVDHTVDRNDRTTTYTYDAVRRLHTVLDPKGQLTQLGWCNCGALSSLTDPSGNVTSWTYGIDGRLLKKIYNDSTEVNYAYEARSGRLHSITDALQQVTQFTYDISNLMTKTEYLNAKIATPQVQFEYDSVFGRLTKMTDGTGVTNFGYNSIPSEGSQSNGGGRLHSVDGPLSIDTIVYGYDAAGRAISTAVNGVAETLAYNANGQLAAVTNPLGTFSYSYEAGTGRLSDVVYPAGKTHLDYWTTGATTESGRLLDIKHYNPALALLSKYGYDYDAAGQITKWSQKQGSQPQTEYALGYDLAGQLQGSTLTATDTETVLKQAFWKYDASGNRTGQTIDAVTTTYTANTLNQMTEVKDGNLLVFKGKVNKPSVVQVQGVSVTADSHNQFSVPLSLTFGAHIVTITAQSGAESVTQTYEVFQGQTLIYDLNGNITSDGKQKYDWDAANRLVKVSTLNPGPANPAKSSEFTYDGLDRRIRIVEKQGVQTVADRRFVWDGTDIVEERSASNSVVKRFYVDGVQLLFGSQTGAFYYQTDHLGSIRSVLNSSGLEVAKYDYDLWGQRTKLSGSFDADFGFTGHLQHEESKLVLTLFRAYSPPKGRWLSRDPLEEDGGVNLYAYVEGSPVNYWDPFGLRALTPREKCALNKGSGGRYTMDMLNKIDLKKADLRPGLRGQTKGYEITLDDDIDSDPKGNKSKTIVHETEHVYQRYMNKVYKEAYPSLAERLTPEGLKKYYDDPREREARQASKNYANKTHQAYNSNDCKNAQ